MVIGYSIFMVAFRSTVILENQDPAYPSGSTLLITNNCYLLSAIMLNIYLILFQPFMMLGRNISEIPCFRSSMITGITGGMASGLAFFMATSKLYLL